MEQDVRRISNRDFTEKEEIANTVIHGAGIIFGIIALPILVSLAVKSYSDSKVLSVCIYGICFLMTFTFSTLYHGLKKQTKKEFFKKLDRISIYFFIAGSYTPFVFYYLFNDTGLVLLYVLWGLVFFGIFFELFLVKRYFFVSVLFYLIMGWLFIFISKQFFASMPSIVITLILAGVALYSIGVIFYVWQKWRYHHAIWHSFVLVASICHYFAVLKTIAA